MEVLDYFGVALGQLMPNLWRIVVSCMGIWLAATDGDMLRDDKLVYLYRLKASKEYGYYELVPWERSTRIVRGLPSSFRYWKSKFFFVSGDNFETPSGGVWGELPRLYRQWGTSTLGASMFLFIILSFILLIVVVANFFRSEQLRHGLSRRTGTENGCGRLLSTRARLRTGTTLWIQGLLLFTTLVRSPLPSS